MPTTIHALIAARLDLLDGQARAVLSAAAVVGERFWRGSLGEAERAPAQALDDSLGRLVAGGFIAPLDDSTIEGDAEYAFGHALIRDVAYGRLPRAVRSARHEAVARWIETRVGDRVDDVADVIAYHFKAALELARATDDAGRVPALVDGARRNLARAGRRAMRLDVAQAVAFLREAIGLTPPGHVDRAELLEQYGHACTGLGRHADALAALGEARAIHHERGDVRAKARVMIACVMPSSRLGDPQSWTLPEEAAAMLEPLGPTPELLDALTETVFNAVLSEETPAARATGERAIAMAAALGVPPPPRLLGFLGVAAASVGDAAGLLEMDDAQRLATESGAFREAEVIAFNQTSLRWVFEGPAAALARLDDGLELARRRGLQDFVVAFEAARLEVLVDLGSIPAVVAQSERLLGGWTGVDDALGRAMVRQALARVLVLQRRPQPAQPWLAAHEAWVRDDRGDDSLSALLSCAALHYLAGDDDAGDVLVDELLGVAAARRQHGMRNMNFAIHAPGAARAFLATGHREAVEVLARHLSPGLPYAVIATLGIRAALAEAAGDDATAAEHYAEAAARWRAFGVVTEEAFSLLGFARAAARIGRPAEARSALLHARPLFDGCGLTDEVAQVDELLAGLGG